MYIIDNFDFWNMNAMKYWSHPKSYDLKKKKEESKYMCVSGNYRISLPKTNFSMNCSMVAWQ